MRFRDGLLYLVVSESRYRLILPQNYKNEVIKTMHESLAYVETSKTLHVVKENFYWVNMDLDVKLSIASCKHCARRKYAKIPKPKWILSVNFTFENISIDIASPLPVSKTGERYILGIIYI